LNNKKNGITKPVKPTGLPPKAQKRADAIALRTELKTKRLEIAKKLAQSSDSQSEPEIQEVERINCLTPFLEAGTRLKIFSEFYEDDKSQQSEASPNEFKKPQD
jgi:hypothetical protein